MKESVAKVVAPDSPNRPRLVITTWTEQRALDPAMNQRNDARGQRDRVAKVIARAGLASRREAESWIAAARVTVNGEVIGSPAVIVGAQDKVAVDGRVLPARERTRLFLFHKPRGALTTHRDPRGRATIFDILPKALPRLVSVGRLDLNTEGLLLLTNDGALARVVELPATGWLRRYRVRAHGRVTQEQLDALQGGITIDGTRYGPIEATADRIQGDNVWLTFAIREGKNREVKNVLGHLGLAVNRLIRVSFGPFRLGDLAPGEIEEVRTRTLREQLGPKVAALARLDFSGPRLEGKDAMQGSSLAVPPQPPKPPRKDEISALRFPTHRSKNNGSHRKKKSSDDLGHIGAPERARREKRRRHAPRQKRG
jgi:23S rRNA pseudouridine2605 synthase